MLKKGQQNHWLTMEKMEWIRRSRRKWKVEQRNRNRLRNLKEAETGTEGQHSRHSGPSQQDRQTKQLPWAPSWPGAPRQRQIWIECNDKLCARPFKCCDGQCRKVQRHCYRNPPQGGPHTVPNLTANTITAVSNHTMREWSWMNQDNLSFLTLHGMNIYV